MTLIRLAPALALALACTPSSQPAHPSDAAGQTVVTQTSAPTFQRTALGLEDVPSPLVVARDVVTLEAIPGATDEPSPIALTASDGTGLQLVKLHARAVVQGPLAFTELRLSFRNPQPRVIEGRFSITLPDGAAISRLAMRTASGWQEAEIVERGMARRVYEDFLHRKQDPALMEKEAGNQFRARVFPIPASGDKELILSYSQELSAVGEDYRLHLRGLPKIDDLQVDALVAGKGAKLAEYRSYGYRASAVVPTGDFRAPGSTLRAVRNGSLVAVRVAPEFGVADDTIDSAAILFDTSASRALGYQRSVQQLAELIAGLPKDATIRVLAFDQQVDTVYEGRASGYGEAHSRALLERQALGASDLSAALRAAAAKGSYRRLILVGDGVATAGDKTSEKVLAAAGEVSASFERADAIALGGITDRDGLERLVRGVFKSDGVVIDGDSAVSRWRERLSRQTRSRLEVAIDGASWVLPRVFDGVQPGDELLVYASVKGSEIKGRIATLDQTFSIPTVTVPHPLLLRSAVRAEVHRLEDELAGAESSEARDGIKKQIVELSTRYRVLSDLTALLVLETAEDYRRYGIEQKSLADILTVGDKGIEIVSRANLVVAVEADKPVEKPKARMKKEVASNERSGSAVPSASAGAREDEADGEADREAPGDFKGAAEAKVAAFDEAEPEPAVAAAEESAGAPLPPPSAAPSPSEARRTVASTRAPARRRPRPAGDMISGGAAGLEFQQQLRNSPPPVTGKLAEVRASIEAGRIDDAVRTARGWRSEAPGDVLALIALGEALEAKGLSAQAARAYGSIIDLFPSRADLRRFAASRLLRIEEARGLAIDSLVTAVEQRPDHLNGHHLLALAYARVGKHEDAFAAAEAGLSRSYPDGRFAGGSQILLEDAELAAAAWLAAEPQRKAEISKKLEGMGGTIADEQSVRFLLTWETDANDVDFHIFDRKGGHAYYSSPHLPSGGELYADVTTGYGPECFTIRGKPKAAPYRLQIHYYSRGPMGYGMGTLDIVKHDGKGGLTFESRPYVVMSDGAYVDLGAVK